MQKESPNDIKESTFFDRLKKLFLKNSETGLHHPKLYLITQCSFAGSIAGFIIGGRIGTRIAAVEHIESTKLSVYKSATHAQREYQSKVIVGFVRNGSRFGWRAGVFSGLYSMLMVILSQENPQNYIINYAAAGACTGVVYNVLSGWRSMVVGAIVGGGLSTPAGLLTSLAVRVAPENLKSKVDVFGHVDVPLEHDEGLTMDESTPEDISSLEDVITQLETSLATPQEETNDA